MGALGQHPIPTAGHPSRVAAVRAYVAEHSGADARSIAEALGCTLRQACMALAQDRHRPRKEKPTGWRRKTPAEVTRDRRARLRAAGKCIHCGEEPPAPGRAGCPDCLGDMRERSRDARAAKAAA